jgi:outer membrane protein assembly factor BamB
MTTIVQPCARQFYPQTTVHQVVTQVTADNLYFVSGVHLYAVNAGNGALRWCELISDAHSSLSQLGAMLEGSGRYGPPPPPDGLVGLAIQNNRLFVTSMSDFTYALSADTGKVIWRHNTGYANGIPIVSGGTLYIPSGTIYALSTQDGSPRWSYPTSDVVTSMPVVVNNTLYTGSYGNAVYALATSSGKARWVYQADGRVYVAPIVDHGVVYAGIGDDGPQLFALDAQTGKFLWQTTMAIDSMAQLLVASGVLYTTDANGLIGLNPETGAVTWQYSGIRNAALLVNGQVLYVAADSGDLYAFDTRTHTRMWHDSLRTLGAGEVSRMTLIGDELYVGFNDLGQDQFASIHAINLQTGREDWSATVRWNVSTLDLA